MITNEGKKLLSLPSMNDFNKILIILKLKMEGGRKTLFLGQRNIINRFFWKL